MHRERESMRHGDLCTSTGLDDQELAALLSAWVVPVLFVSGLPVHCVRLAVVVILHKTPSLPRTAVLVAVGPVWASDDSVPLLGLRKRQRETAKQPKSGGGRSSPTTHTTAKEMQTRSKH